MCMHATYGEIQASLHHLLLPHYWHSLLIQYCGTTARLHQSRFRTIAEVHSHNACTMLVHAYFTALYRRTTPHQKLDHHLPQWNGSCPICSMYAIFTNLCPKNQPNVGKYTIHGAYGFWSIQQLWTNPGPHHIADQIFPVSNKILSKAIQISYISVDSVYPST